MADTSVRDIERGFRDVLETLDQKDLRNSMRTAMRREGKRVVERAKSAVLASGLGHGKRQDVSRGITLRVYPQNLKGAGFMVTTKPRRGTKRGIHVNRQRKEKPVLMWAEEGTRWRRVGRRKSSFFSLSRWTGRKYRNYVRSGHSTGRMPKYGFMEKTERSTLAQTEQGLFQDFEKIVMRRARKKGLV